MKIIEHIEKLEEKESDSRLLDVSSFLNQLVSDLRGFNANSDLQGLSKYCDHIELANIVGARSYLETHSSKSLV